MAIQCCSQRLACFKGSPIVTTSWLRQNFVDHTKAEQILAGDPQRSRSLGSLRRITPKNRGAGLRAGHRVDAVLEHQQAIRHANPERTTGTTLAPLEVGLLK